MRPKENCSEVTGEHSQEGVSHDTHPRRPLPQKNLDWQRELIRSVAGELEPRLVFSTMRREVGYAGIEQICKATSASREQFEEWCRQVRTLIDQVIVCAIDLEGDSVPIETIAEEQAKLRQELLQGVVFPSPPEPIVDYKFADLVPEQAFQSAVGTLRSECVAFASNFVHLLKTLQDSLVVGSIAHARTSCKAEFYRHRIVFEALETQLRSYPSQTLRDFSSPNRIDVYREQGFKVVTATISHVHHVHHPVRRKVGSEKYPIPVQFVPILQSIPPWLAPSVRILEGTQINEIQREERSSERSNMERQYVSSTWQLEPAILVGNFVLAGWNEKEIEAERRRRDKSGNKAHLRQRSIQSWGLSVLAGILGAASVACMAYSTWFQTLSLVSLAFGAGAVYAASHGSTLNRRAGTSELLSHRLVVTVATFLPLAAVYGVVHRSVPAIVLGIAGIVIAAVTLWGRTVVIAVREEFGE